MNITIDGLKIHYEQYGTQGRPVVLLHGWGQNVAMMAAIGEFLADHFTVYNLDFPGFGESDEMKEAWGVKDYTEFLAHFLAAFAVKDPIIIAHSFGCRVALNYAYRYGAYKMCLTGAAGLKDKHGLTYYIKVYSYKLGKKILSLKPLRPYLKAFQDRSGSEDYRNASGVMRSTFVKVVNSDVREILPLISTETLLVFGDQDSATPIEKGKEMEKLMPNAALAIFEGDDHFAYFHQQSRFNRVLEAFLKNDYD